MQRQPVRPLIVALVVAMAPLLFQLPWWAVGWCATAWGYLLVRERRGWAEPSRGVRLAIFIIGVAAVLLLGGLRFDGRDFIALLAVMAGIKPLEISSRRDSMVTVFLAYFMVITSLFIFENLSMTLYLFLTVWVTTGVLIHVNNPNGELRSHMHLSARLVLVAVPLMVMLFLLFPRLSGSFWGSPWDRYSRSGFSETMRMGDVSRLVLVDAPAFSVSFDSEVPEADRLYWRGIVFQRFDGAVWHPTRNQEMHRTRVSGGNLSRYTVMLEPHGRRHLFVLDLPVTANPVATILDNHTLAARQSIRKRFHYDAVSVLDYQQDFSGTPGDAYLQLPSDRNPRAIALGTHWSRTHSAGEAIVATAMAFFRENDFAYTLQPDQLGVDAVDDFLFSSRNGFCEHFAAAFAVLMRASGVPTRIVGGYQGGTWNALGEFLTVRHSDAHVWCEVWLQGKGWVRVDPTFAVAPDRIESGIESALSEENRFGIFGRNPGHLLARWTEMAHLALDAVNIRWQMWFMGFSAEDQTSLLKRIGISVGRQGKWMLFMVLAPLFIVIVTVVGRLHRKTTRPPPKDEALKVYRRFLSKMARIGLPKAPYQGPLDYARFVVEQHPTLKREVSEIADCYIALRYGHEGSSDALRDFRMHVMRFSPEQLGASRHPNRSSVR